jgi:hypothetical protein
MKSVETCSADGLSITTEQCALNCSGTTPHCESIVPAYLSTICDLPATSDELVISTQVTLNTNTDALCNGGVLFPGEPNEVCVVRHKSIRIEAPVVAIGRRSLALVGDAEVKVTSEIDVSANGLTDGAGGGLCISGLKQVRSSQTAYQGGGGSGFRTNGADGYNHAGSGGLGLSPVNRFFGGCRPELTDGTDDFAGIGKGGGGGGGLMMIACRGTVTVTGTIDAGGGGGAGGSNGLVSLATGGGGGGAGGFVVMQGVQVIVTGSFYANGGAGGGGARDTASAAGVAGQDGQRSTARATGGPGFEGGGSGGLGGTSLAPTIGGAPSISTGAGGGGGGAAGRFRVYVPAGGTSAIAPSASSPSFDAVEAIMVR